MHAVAFAHMLRELAKKIDDTELDEGKIVQFRCDWMHYDAKFSDRLHGDGHLFVSEKEALAT